MNILLCIDDTDNIESRGTGEIATLISHSIEEKNWGSCSRITRHQLLIHPDVPYTSHNSSMCFEADINDLCLEQIINFASDFLEKECAEGSDPGLCVVVRDKILEPKLLIEFGRKTKKEVVSKSEAYSLAIKIGVHLSEHGGTGQGIIGALAGIGLRMTGNDGRFKGKINLESKNGIENVEYILLHTDIERVKDIKGSDLNGKELVIIEEPLKTVLLDGKSTLLVFRKYNETKNNLLWEPCKKQQISVY
jgi:hypothetical protein